MKKIIKLLQSYAHSSWKDIQSVFVEMLDFFINSFDPCLFFRYRGNVTAWFAERKTENPMLFEALENWLYSAKSQIESTGICDFFGELYESIFLGKTKATAMGQFFTPLPLCQVMTSLLPSDHRMVVGEPSCGSGRNVLAHWQKADKDNLIEYNCEDLDPCCVKMCALNMMINGMYGQVICHDSLDQSSFHFGYKINEVRYPFPSPYYSIRAITRDEYLKR